MRIKLKPNPVWRFPVTSLDQRHEAEIAASVASSKKARRNDQRALERAERVVRRQRRPSIGTPLKRPGDWWKNTGSNVRMAGSKRIQEHAPDLIPACALLMPVSRARPGEYR